MAAVELFSTILYSDANLKAYYRLENTADSGPNSYTLSNATGTPTFAAGKFNNASSYGGTAAHTNASLVWSATSSWSVMFWIFDTASTGNFRRWVMNNNGGLAANDFIIREDNGGNIQLLINNGAGNEITTGLTGNWKNVWTHFAVVSNGTTTKVYRDGNTTEILSTNNVSTPTNGIFIGGYNSSGSNEFTTALFDDLAVYNRALTTTEINDYYNGNLAPARTTKNLGLLGVG